MKIYEKPEIDFVQFESEKIMLDEVSGDGWSDVEE